MRLRPLLLLSLASCHGSSSHALDAAVVDAGPSLDCACTVADGPLPDAVPAADAEPKVSHLFVGTQTTLAPQGEGLDLDGDGKSDDELGAVEATFESQGLGTVLDVSPSVTATYRWLFDLQAVSLDADPTARLFVYVGVDGDSDPGNDFGGAGVFQIDGAAPTDRFLDASIVSTLVSAQPGSAIVVPVTFSGANPVLLTLHGARLVGTSSPLEGTLGGGITAADMTSIVDPAIAASMNTQIAADPTSSRSMQLLQLFDTDKNGTITGDELANSGTWQTVTTPDVDLLDAAGDEAPTKPGDPGWSPDCTSIAIQLTTTTAASF